MNDNKDLENKIRPPFKQQFIQSVEAFYTSLSEIAQNQKGLEDYFISLAITVCNRWRHWEIETHRYGCQVAFTWTVRRCSSYELQIWRQELGCEKDPVRLF